MQPESVIHSVTEFLFAAQVAFRRLNGDVPQEKLDLFQFATCKMAQTCASAAQIMGRQIWNSSTLSSSLDNVPYCF